MSKIYPHGYFQRSDSNLVDPFGNYIGNSFKVPAFLDTVILDGFSGNITFGNIVLEKNGNKRYPLSIGVEREVVAEPGDSFRLLVENGEFFNSLYSYQIGFRYAEREGDIEVSESTLSSIVLKSSSDSSS
jgi:hypothetical protein